MYLRAKLLTLILIFLLAFLNTFFIMSKDDKMVCFRIECIAYRIQVDEEVVAINSHIKGKN